jgi:hypothetical protein
MFTNRLFSLTTGAKTGDKFHTYQE